MVSHGLLTSAHWSGLSSVIGLSSITISAPNSLARFSTTFLRSNRHSCIPRSQVRFDNVLSVGSGVLGLATSGSAVANK